MLIILNRAILHILDFNSGVAVFSEQELDPDSPSVLAFLSKHIEKAYQDSNAKTGKFLEHSKFKQQVAAYYTADLDFAGFSMFAAELAYSVFSQSDAPVPSDFLLCDCTVDDRRVMAVLNCGNRLGFTHQVVQQGDKIRNEIIYHHAILPGLAQKLDEYAFIDLETLQILMAEKKRVISGEESYPLSERMLECTLQISPRETVKMVNTIARDVAEKYGKNTVEAVTKAKTCLAETAELSEYVDPVELGRKVFEGSPALQQEYWQEVQNAGLSEPVKVDKSLALRNVRSHKIKTDTGIELIFPADYFQSTEYIEFINNPDGTLSISLKNIGKIINK